MPSYSPVFSSGFIYGTGGTPNHQFIVPEGFTAVIRDVTLFSAIGGEDASCQVSGPGADYAVVFAFLQVIGVAGSAQWSGRVVAPAGWLIQLNEGGLNESSGWYVGGYLLRNTLT